MRWFVAFLLVGNVILYFWIQHESRPKPGGADLPAPDVGRLQLLNGTEHGQPAAGAPTHAAAESGAVGQATPDEPGAAVAETGIASPGAAETGADLREDNEAPAWDSGTDGGGLGDARFPAPTSAPPATPPGRVPGATAGIVPDPSTRGVAPSARAVPDPVPDPAPETALETAPASPGSPAQSGEAGPGFPPAPATPAPVCARLGPFEPDAADQLVANLPAHLVVVSDVSEEYDAIDGYFVLIPPLPSREAGVKMLEKLADAGIDDTWLFPSGRHRNGISLGLFGRESLASRHAANVEKKGFAAEVHARTTRKEGRWLVLQAGEDTDIASSLPLPDAVSVEDRPCP